jgi:hypothetical protein
MVDINYTFDGYYFYPNTNYKEEKDMVVFPLTEIIVDKTTSVCETQLSSLPSDQSEYTKALTGIETIDDQKFDYYNLV